MSQKDKGLFQDALKEYDNKDFKKCKKSCDKILSKSPSDQEALALKGLAEMGLGEKETGEKLIKEAIKINMKNAKVWQFYALFHKENKNYNQAVKCYTYSIKYDSENINVVKDLSNLLLYLGRFEDYNKYSLQCIITKSSLGTNWAQYCLSEFFIKNYIKALNVI